MCYHCYHCSYCADRETEDYEGFKKKKKQKPTQGHSAREQQSQGLNTVLIARSRPLNSTATVTFSCPLLQTPDVHLFPSREVLKGWFVDNWGFLSPFQGDSKVKTIFLILMLRRPLPFSLMAQRSWSETVHALVGSKEVASICRMNPCFLHHHTLSVRKKCQFT